MGRSVGASVDGSNVGSNVVGSKVGNGVGGEVGTCGANSGTPVLGVLLGVLVGSNDGTNVGGCERGARVLHEHEPMMRPLSMVNENRQIDGSKKIGSTHHMTQYKHIVHAVACRNRRNPLRLERRDR